MAAAAMPPPKWRPQAQLTNHRAPKMAAAHKNRHPAEPPASALGETLKTSGGRATRLAACPALELQEGGEKRSPNSNAPTDTTQWRPPSALPPQDGGRCRQTPTKMAAATRAPPLAPRLPSPAKARTSGTQDDWHSRPLKAARRCGAPVPPTRARARRGTIGTLGRRKRPTAAASAPPKKGEKTVPQLPSRREKRRRGNRQPPNPCPTDGLRAPEEREQQCPPPPAAPTPTWSSQQQHVLSLRKV
nr:proline-rich protein 2-like [Anolis sagrei ordinatus]